MIKLIRLCLFLAFLFASAPPDYGLIVNNKGNLEVIAFVAKPEAVNATFAPSIFEVEANANSPPVSI